MTYSTVPPRTHKPPVFCGRKDIITEEQLSPNGVGGRIYIVDGFLAQGDLAVAYGVPKAGKSLFWLRAARRISQGELLFGRPAGFADPVLYIATEGKHGLAERLEALRQVEGSAPNFRVTTKPINLMDPASLEELIDWAGETLVVIDTLGRLMGSCGLDENGPDMGRLIANIDKLRVKSGAAVVLITHGTKAGGNGPRGNLSLTGAADVIVAHSRLSDGSSVATVTEARDTAPGLSFRYGLRSIPLPNTSWREGATSVVAEELPEPERKAAGRPRAGYQAIALDCLQKAGGQASLEQWRTGFDEALPALTVVNRRQQFRRTRMELEKAGQVMIVEGMVRQTA